MKLDAKDIKRLQWAIAFLVIMALAGGGSVWSTQQLQKSSERTFKEASAARSEIQAKLARARDEQAELRDKIGRFQALKTRGYIGPEQRLDWIETIARIKAALDRKRQVILYGPPGTGKTYWAERAAQELAARSWHECSLPYLTEAERDALPVELCTFHPAYGYEDFLEGYRPEVRNDALVYVLRDGIFKNLCERAGGRPDKDFYLIIDEINRGDIPRIFGELLTALEKD